MYSVELVCKFYDHMGIIERMGCICEVAVPSILLIRMLI